MPLDVHKPDDRKRLYEAIDRSYRDLDRYRKKRQSFIEDYVGHHYLKGDQKDKENLVPEMYKLVRTYAHKLVARRPRFLTETEYTFKKPFARRGGLALNRRMIEIDFENTLRECVVDAMFLVGIAEIHNGESYPLDFGDGYEVDPGLPSICRVSPDDFFYDTTASCLKEAAFIGKHYRIEREALLDDPNIEKKLRDKLFTTWNNSADRDGSSLNKAMSQGGGSSAELLTPVVECMSVYLPKTKEVVALLKDDGMADPLRRAGWTGSKNGPWRLLSFGLVPDNIMPLAPAFIAEPMHNLENNLTSKNRDQAERQKTVIGFPESGKDDAERHKKAVDGEYVKMRDVNNLKVFSNGGPDQTIAAFAISVAQQFNEATGNVKAMGGLGQQADTYGQEQMLYGAASAIEADMKQTVLQFAADCGSDLFHLLMADQFYEADNFYEAPAKQLKVHYPWRPEIREGKAEDYPVSVEPYSLLYVSPGQKFAGLTSYLTNTLAVLMQFGSMIDLQELNEMAAEYLDEPRLRDIVKFGQSAPMDPNQFPSEGLPSAGKPNGEYTRKNVPSAGSSGYAEKMVQTAMLGGKPAMGNMPGVRDAS